MTSTTVTCHTCQLPASMTDAQPFRVLMPTNSRRNGHEILAASDTLYECETCQTANAGAGNEHIYTVSSCGILRTVGASTPEEAATLLMQDRGWRSTRSIAVLFGNTWCEFLDCEIVNGQLQFSEQVHQL